jgi:hypothetical protein
MRGEMEIGKQGVMALMQRGLDRHPPLITQDWEESRELLESGVFFYKTTLEYVPAGSGSLCSPDPPVSGPLSSIVIVVIAEELLSCLPSNPRKL